jgi:hypothetical protein
MKQIFVLIVFLIPAIFVGQVHSKDRPPKPKTILKGIWYYNGVGGLSDSSSLDSTIRIYYTKLPVKSHDTIAFIDSTTLTVNSRCKYNYKIEYKWSDAGINDNSFWQMYLIINDNEYFVHFAYDYIELQNWINHHRWYGRYSEVLTPKKLINRQ